MSDVSGTQQAPVVSRVQERLDQIRAEREAVESAAAAAVKGDDDRRAVLDAAKAKCESECGEVTAALAEATDPRERIALIELEAQTHASHAAELEQAHLAFAGQRSGDANPAQPGSTPIDAAITVTSEDPGAADAPVS